MWAKVCNTFNEVLTHIKVVLLNLNVRHVKAADKDGVEIIPLTIFTLSANVSDTYSRNVCYVDISMYDNSRRIKPS